MPDIGVKQVCPLSPTLFSLYIHELQMYLDKVGRDSPCLFNTMVVILFSHDICFYVV
jgi:hypothetical protein